MDKPVLLEEKVRTETGAVKNRYRCACGKVFLTYKHSVDSGRTRSCGCLQRRRAAELRTSHGMTGTPTFRSWDHMIQRTINPNYPRWADWGGRGITVCDEWRSFSQFFADMGARPEGTTLDRIDNEKGYFKENCRWSTPAQQAKNRRPTREYVRRSPVFTSEGRARLSAAMKERVRTRSVHPMQGKHHTTESRALMAENQERHMVQDQYGTIYVSINAAARAIGASCGHVANVVNGRTPSAKGYVFKRIK